jgi:NAD(P)-dependent dehydrogenase (short-subunit alcohol dehydrogenase family)
VRAYALTVRRPLTYLERLGEDLELRRLTLKGKVMAKLDGKTAVITGGATGIGRAAAKRFIEEGAFVFIFGRRQEALDAAVAELGPNARAVKGSVSDESDLDRLYAEVKAERGTLDIVFANAGAGSQGPGRGKLMEEFL